MLTFVARFNPADGSLAEAYATDDRGQVWGSLPSVNHKPDTDKREDTELAYTASALTIIRQEAYMRGLERAKNAAWEQHKHHGKEKATALQVHDALLALTIDAEIKLDRMRSAN